MLTEQKSSQTACELQIAIRKCFA